MLQLQCAAAARRHTHTVLAQRPLAFSAPTRSKPRFAHLNHQLHPAFASTVLVRRFSVPAGSSPPRPSTSTSSGSEEDLLPPPPSQPSKKPKLDLRPAPIKPKPPSPGAAQLPKEFEDVVAGASSATASSNASSSVKEEHAGVEAHAHAQTGSGKAPHGLGLGAAKEEVVHDIHDAEAHGILKPPPPGANWFKRTLHQGIELFKFYYRGVKLIFSRTRAIVAINQRIKGGGAALSRAEFRLIETQKDDIKKVIPFLIIALLLEEVIPLIAIYAPFMLPSTCILPSQRVRIEAKRAEKAAVVRAAHGGVYAALRQGFGPDLGVVRGEAVVSLIEALNAPQATTAVCGLLGLSTLGTDFLRLRRIHYRLGLLTEDDNLLLANLPQVLALSRRELVEALEERGIQSQDLAQKDLQMRLLLWLNAVKDTPDGDAALVRRLALAVSLA